MIMEEDGHGMAFKSLRDIKEHITLLVAGLCRISYTKSKDMKPGVNDVTYEMRAGSRHLLQQI